MPRLTFASLIVASVLGVSSFGTIAMAAEGKLKVGDPAPPLDRLDLAARCGGQGIRTGSGLCRRVLGDVVWAVHDRSCPTWAISRTSIGRRE